MIGFLVPKEAKIVKDDFARNRDYDWYEIVDLREWTEL